MVSFATAAAAGRLGIGFEGKAAFFSILQDLAD